MTAEQRRRKLPGAIIKWYDIKRESKVACVVCEQGNSRLTAEALEEGLCVEWLKLETLDMPAMPKRLDGEATGTASRKEINDGYDIIIAVDIIEYAHNPAAVLKSIHNLLKPDGRFLLAADNRLGIRYFCGDQDAFSGKVYDSVENYVHLFPQEREEMKGRAYSKAELVKFLEEAGFRQRRVFSVFPRISNPQLLLAEDYVPNESLDIRIFPEYNNPDTVFLFEEELYPSLLANGLLHSMANGFFIECAPEDSLSPVNQVTLSGERGVENAMATILRRDGLVEKRALYQPGRMKLRQLSENNEYLTAHGVRMIPGELRQEAFVMPYVTGIPANDYFRELLIHDKAAFLKQLDNFRDILLHSSEPVAADEVNWEQFEPGWEKRKMDDPNRDKWRKIAFGSPEERETLGVILKRGYLDLVSLNCFYNENAFVFYDQELFLENVPMKAILFEPLNLFISSMISLMLFCPEWSFLRGTVC